MNKYKKMICITLVLTIILSLTGCGFLPTTSSLKTTADSKEMLENALAFLENAESYELSYSLDLKMECYSKNDETSIFVGVDSKQKYHVESGTKYGYADVTFTGAKNGENDLSKIDQYIVQKDGELKAYNKIVENGVRNWQECDINDCYEFIPDIQKILKKFIKNSDDFKLVDKSAKYAYNTCYLLQGEADNLGFILKMYQAQDYLGDFDYDDIKVSVKVYIDKQTAELVGIAFDLAEGLEDIYSNDSEIEQAKIKEFTVYISCESMNEFGEIELQDYT